MADPIMSLDEIRDRADDEIRGLVLRGREELFRLRLGRFTNQLENTMQIRNKRRELARMLTILSRRRHGDENKGQTFSSGGATPRAERTPEEAKATKARAATPAPTKERKAAAPAKAKA